MSNKEIKAKDILLLLLYLPGKGDEKNEPILGKTRITKMIFLFEKELLKNFTNISEKSLPVFYAYNYGPFSKDLLDDIRFFNAIGFIDETVIQNNESNEADVAEYIQDISEDLCSDDVKLEDIDYPGEIEFSLTEKGIKYVEEKLINTKKFDEFQLDILMRFKKTINSLTLNQLLTYVYRNYDDMTEKSLIRDKILG